MRIKKKNTWRGRSTELPYRRMTVLLYRWADCQPAGTHELRVRVCVVSKNRGVLPIDDWDHQTSALKKKINGDSI